jgi:hypothetical protein
MALMKSQWMVIAVMTAGACSGRDAQVHRGVGSVRAAQEAGIALANAERGSMSASLADAGVFVAQTKADAGHETHSGVDTDAGVDNQREATRDVPPKVSGEAPRGADRKVGRSRLFVSPKVGGRGGRYEVALCPDGSMVYWALDAAMRGTYTQEDALIRASYAGRNVTFTLSSNQQKLEADNVKLRYEGPAARHCRPRVQ